MLVGLSGALLVFYWEIDTAVTRDKFRVDHASVNPDFDAMLSVVRKAYPDRLVLSFERYGLSNTESYPFILTKQLPMTSAGPDMSGVKNLARAPALEVFVDPQADRIIGDRGYWTWFRLLRSFHMELFFPETGERIVGALGVVLLTTVIVGAIMWWNESKHRLGHALRLHPSAAKPRLFREIHTVGGIYVTLFLAQQACSGALVADLFPVQTVIRSLFGQSFAWPPSDIGAETVTPITANAARDVALALHPNSDIVQLVFPNALFKYYSIRLYPTDQPKTRFTRQVFIDPKTGKIVLTFDPSGQSFFRRLSGLWMIWIHNGQFFGLPGRLILVATGLMLTLLFPTGLYLWLRKWSLARADTTAGSSGSLEDAFRQDIVQGVHSHCPRSFAAVCLHAPRIPIGGNALVGIPPWCRPRRVTPARLKLVVAATASCARA